jgi:hypothetical protein
MKHKILALLAVIFVSSFVAAQTKTDVKTETELKALVKQMTDAQVRYDTITLDKIFTNDYIEISPVGEFDPREKVLGFYTPEAKSKMGGAEATVETDDFSIRSYDKFAIVIARFSFTRKIAGELPRPPFNIRATLVCRKEKGVWKIATASYTGIRPPQPQTPAPKPQ